MNEDLLNFDITARFDDEPTRWQDTRRFLAARAAILGRASYPSQVEVDEEGCRDAKHWMSTMAVAATGMASNFTQVPARTVQQLCDGELDFRMRAICEFIGVGGYLAQTGITLKGGLKDMDRFARRYVVASMIAAAFAIRCVNVHKGYVIPPSSWYKP